MGKLLFIIDEVFKDKAMAAFESFGVQYRIAGYPNGSAIVRETFPSKLNTMPCKKVKKKPETKKIKSPKSNQQSKYDKMLNYAQSLGCNNVMEAISKLNGARHFKRNFEKEHQKT